MHVGTVTKFEADKGFGRIRPRAGGQEVFVHVTAIANARVLRPGDRVTYEIRLDHWAGKDEAFAVQPYNQRKQKP